MVEKYPNYYNSYEQFVEAQNAEKALKKDIQDKLVEHAPSEEIRLALLAAIAREES